MLFFVGFETDEAVNEIPAPDPSPSSIPQDHMTGPIKFTRKPRTFASKTLGNFELLYWFMEHES